MSNNTKKYYETSNQIIWLTSITMLNFIRHEASGAYDTLLIVMHCLYNFYSYCVLFLFTNFQYFMFNFYFDIRYFYFNQHTFFKKP